MNWEEHKKKYSAMAAANGGLSIAAYAELHGLNANTARKHLRKTDRDHSQADPVNDPKNDPSFSKLSRTKKARKNSKINDEITSGTLLPAKGDQIPKSAKLIPAKKNRPRGRAFAPGNRASMTSGVYTQLTPDEILQAQAMIDNGLVENLEDYAFAHLVAHVHLISSCRDEALEALDNSSDSGDKDADSGGPPVEVKKLGMIASTAEPLAGSLRTLIQIKQSRDKAKREAFREEQKALDRRVVIEAFRLKEEKDWSAIDTATYIEAQGVRVPPALEKMMANELRLIEPEIDLGEEWSDEQLDDEAQIYARKRARQLNEFLPQRREEIQLLSDQKGFGDVNTEGLLHEGGILLDDDDDDDDWDDEATSEYYSSAAHEDSE
ncbi:MAG TPA: hypothetical protein VGL07_16875 [Buttiauxella sp.]